MDDLFAAEHAARRLRAAPLAERMRPRTLDEVVGQPHLMASGAAFRSVVESGKPPSMVLWGPPGSGKTTLARLVADRATARFEQLSATTHGVKDVRNVIAAARERLEQEERRTILFLDEIHRFAKSQQDALLPAVEKGTVILVGATTENPFFEVNAPLISRCTLFRLEGLSAQDVQLLVERAVADTGRGLGAAPPVTSAAVTMLAERTGGDARLALSALEVAAQVAAGRGSDVGEAEVVEALQRRVIRYDKGGDRHYDVLSAFIKSLRGSDPDAALYWLHTMLEAGEDPELIARRMVILASEDIGLADSGALQVAIAAAHALQFVGLPEAAHSLSHAAVYLAAASKSNSVTLAMARAREVVSAGPVAEVPLHLRRAAHAGLAELGYGDDYVYPHDHAGGLAPQRYLPGDIAEASIYLPVARGDEADLADRLDRIDETMGRPRRPRL